MVFTSPSVSSMADSNVSEKQKQHMVAFFTNNEEVHQLLKSLQFKSMVINPEDYFGRCGTGIPKSLWCSGVENCSEANVRYQIVQQIEVLPKPHQLYLWRAFCLVLVCDKENQIVSKYANLAEFIDPNT